MSTERFLREFCNGDVMIHPEDLPEYKEYMFAHSQESANSAGQLVMEIQECELNNYFSVGTGNDLDILKGAIKKLRGLQ